MPRSQWRWKRERQYQHIKESEKRHSRSKGVAEEIAARTVNKERARHGQSKTASRPSTQDMSPGRRGGLRPHRGLGGRTAKQLYEVVRRKNIKGRFKMNKAELKMSVDAA